MTAFDQGLLDPVTGAAQVVDDRALLSAMVDVEAAHLAALTDAGLGSDAVRWDVSGLDLPGIAAAGAAGGNPVIPLVTALRRDTPHPLADLVHLGLTSQDVLDSAMMLLAVRAIAAAEPGLHRVLAGLADLADEERTTPVAGRTLGQHAAPTTAGLRLSVQLDGITRTWRHLAALDLPLQLGGSVATLAVLADRLGPDRAAALRTDVASRLGLTARTTVWHVERSPVALLGAALAAVIGALGRLGLETVQGTRAEIGELALAQAVGHGGSSAMPQKQNPVPAVLLVAAARRAPGLAATLLAAQLALDDRPAGDWHAEWQPLRELLRLVVESTALADRLVPALTIDRDRAAANLGSSHGAIHAERAQQTLAASIGRGRAAELVDMALTEGDFVAGIRRAARQAGVEAEVLDALDAATRVGGPVGLSESLIDAAVLAAREETR